MISKNGATMPAIAAMVELLHDAFIEEFNKRGAEAYFFRFI